MSCKGFKLFTFYILGECKKLKDLLDAMVEWNQSLLIHKIENIPSSPEPTKPSPKDANSYDK